MKSNTLLTSEDALLSKCRDLEGLSLAQLAHHLGWSIPRNPLQRKGWVGMALELALGTTAGVFPVPDFVELGIELKSIPINHLGKPAESTFVTSISLLTIHRETWGTSQCFSKLKRVLWVPVEADKRLEFSQRRIGRAQLWSPTHIQNKQLEEDWLELTSLIIQGKLEDIHAGLGMNLQIRPKASNGKSLCHGFDEHGNKILTLPRGFYLRSSFTNGIIQ